MNRLSVVLLITVIVLTVFFTKPNPATTNDSPVAANSIEPISSPQLDSSMEEVQAGGDLFFKELSCSSCHSLDDDDEYAPSLKDVGSRLSLELLRQSIVDPNAVIRKKYQTLYVLKKDGKTIEGSLAEETPDRIELNVDGSRIVILRKDVDHIKYAPSSMPTEFGDLSEDKLSQLVQFLSRQRASRSISD